MKGSWKTTAGGISGILVVVFGAVQLMLDGKPETNPDWTLVIGAITAGIGLIFARDNNKTSEQVDAGPK